MAKYYTPTLEDFVLGLDYETKATKDEDWKPAKITRESYISEGGGLTTMNIIAHDLYQKEPKNEYRVKCLEPQDFIDRGFTKSTPVFIGNIMYHTFHDKELYIQQTGTEVLIQLKNTTHNVYEGTIINSTMLDVILGTLDLDSSANYKLRRKLTLATNE
jgi:hypothetical protein